MAQPDTGAPPRGAGPRPYRIVGLLCLGVSLPSWVFLVLGRLAESRNPFYLLPFAGTIPGVLLLAFGSGRLRRSSLSDTGLRVAGIGLAFVVFLLGSWAGVGLGVFPLMTSVRFCAMISSYLGFLATILLAVAALRGRRLDTGSGPP